MTSLAETAGAGERDRGAPRAPVGGVARRWGGTGCGAGAIAAALVVLVFAAPPGFAQGAGAAQGGDEVETPAEAARELMEAPPPPLRPQVPYAGDEPEITVYGRSDPFGLPDSIRDDIWRQQQREMQAMLLERERYTNPLAREGFDALVGSRLAILPYYNPLQERQIDYGVNDSQPAGVINLFGIGFGRKKDD